MMFSPITIVKADWTDELAEHAASELASYLKRITETEVRTVSPPEAVDLAGPVITLAIGETAAHLRDLPGGGDPQRLRDGFVLESAGPARLRIAALTPTGLLYGVYEYLEHHCGIGFFWDGEYLPRLKTLPLSDISDAQIPRWPLRHWGRTLSWGLSKWHNMFRTAEERRRIFDWMAKRRLNWTSHAFGACIAASGIAAVEAFGIEDGEPDDFTFAGWPGTVDFPAATRTAMIQDDLSYARDRGIRAFYFLAFGSVPHQLAKMHPEYPFLGQLGYSATTLHPDSKEAMDYFKRFYGAIERLHGTDHILHDTPFAESTGANSPEGSYELKLAAAYKLLDLYAEIDPEAIWEWDTWDFSVLPEVWTPERRSRYLNALPKDKMLVYDLNDIPQDPGRPVYEQMFYQSTNYFEGAKWSYGVLHCFQGEDHLHGELRRLLDELQAISAEPAAQRCQGMHHAPETNGHNVLFFDFTTHLAWNPDEMTLDGYLDAYARRRYGAANCAAMRVALQKVVDAVHSDYEPYWQVPTYKKLGFPQVPLFWPIFSHLLWEPMAPHSQKDVDRMRELREALQAALPCRRSQQDNPLYENDLVDWTRTYLGLAFSWAVFDAQRAFKTHDLARVKSSTALARAFMMQIEMILSTREDFHLQPQIDAAMAEPGVNPYTPWYMKQGCVNWLYATNEVYEQMHWYYAPRMEIFFDELERRTEAKAPSFHWDDIKAACAKVETRWLNEDIRVPDDLKYPGTAMEAVLAAIDVIEETASKVEMMIEDYLTLFAPPTGALVLGTHGEHVEKTGDWEYWFNASAQTNRAYYSAKGSTDAAFRWNLKDVKPGRYEVFAWIPQNTALLVANEMTYTVGATDDAHATVVNAPEKPKDGAWGWHSLGVHSLDAAGYIEAAPGGKARAVADSIALVPTP